MRNLYRALIVTLFIAATLASEGDTSPDFQKCLIRCPSSGCELSLALRLTRWSCLDNCKYSCMHDITARRVAAGSDIVQYYGKWPFWRFLGMQEPASVAFSLLNLWFHAIGNQKLHREIPTGHPMRSFYLVWSYASINLWIWSAVFHTRDTSVTEKLDYFSAAMSIGLGLYVAVIRLFHLYPKTRNRLVPTSVDQSRPRILRLWTLLSGLIYLGHVSYLSLSPQFDYSYNIVFNLIIGLIHNGLWMIYSLPANYSILRRFPSEPKAYRPSFVGSAGRIVAITTVATGLELFDFPAIGGVIDAHSLWHLATAPLVGYWYQFLVSDALDGSWRELRA